MPQTVEAVYITGPRKGELFTIPEENVPEVTDEELALLNKALDEAIAAADRLSQTLKEGIESMKGFSVPN